jgi:hypothetical protein
MTHEHDDAQLEALARGLGAAAAERLDVERTAAAVVERLRQEPVVRRTHWRQPTWWRIAAAVVLMVGAGILVRPRFAPGDAGQTPQYLSADLQDLSTDQLQEVLSTLDQTLTDPAPLVPPEDDWTDLTTEQLQAVLRSLEG